MGFGKQVRHLFRHMGVVLPAQGNALAVTHKSRGDPVHFAFCRFSRKSAPAPAGLAPAERGGVSSCQSFAPLGQAQRGRD